MGLGQWRRPRRRKRWIVVVLDPSFAGSRVFLDPSAFEFGGGWMYYEILSVGGIWWFY